MEVRGRDSPERDATNQLAKALPRESSSEEEDVVGRRNAYARDTGDEKDDERANDECRTNVVLIMNGSVVLQAIVLGMI